MKTLIVLGTIALVIGLVAAGAWAGTAWAQDRWEGNMMGNGTSGYGTMGPGMMGGHWDGNDMPCGGAYFDNVTFAQIVNLWHKCQYEKQ